MKEHVASPAAAAAAAAAADPAAPADAVLQKPSAAGSGAPSVSASPAADGDETEDDDDGAESAAGGPGGGSGDVGSAANARMDETASGADSPAGARSDSGSPLAAPAEAGARTPETMAGADGGPGRAHRAAAGPQGEDGASGEEVEELEDAEAAEKAGAPEAASGASDNGALEACGLWEADEAADGIFAEGVEIARRVADRDRSLRKDKGDKPAAPRRAGRAGKEPGEFRHVRRSKRAGGKKLARRAAREEEEDAEGDGGTETETEDDGAGSDICEDSDAAAAPSKRPSRPPPRPARPAQARVRRAKQEASAIVLEKAVAEESGMEALKLDQSVQGRLKALARAFLAALLNRAELLASFSDKGVKRALRGWVPADSCPGELGRRMRGSEPCPPELLAAKARLKAQLKEMHPAVASGGLRSLSNPGIRRVQARPQASLSVRCATARRPPAGGRRPRADRAPRDRRRCWPSSARSSARAWRSTPRRAARPRSPRRGSTRSASPRRL